ncbi:MAG TPA: serine hydrolase domain-containing protein [Candidatus Limnocylindria bacterium]
MTTATARRPRRRSPVDHGLPVLLARWPSVGLAIGLVRAGQPPVFVNHGLADVAAGTPVSEDTVFRIGSITKTMTAIAIMQLWERGLVDLDAPANDYLRSVRLIPAHPRHRPATLRQLMTHTAGVPEVLRPLDIFKPLFGEITPAGRPMPTVAKLYRGGLHLSAEPGTRFIYTDHGFTTLAQLVEDVSGEPFDRYLRSHVFEPLGMTHTDLVRSERVREGLASGYVMTSRGPRAVDDYEVVTAGGGGVYSTMRDMARYAAALMGHGANEHGSVLEPASLRIMYEPHYQPDRRVPGLGLAFDRHDAGGHLVIGHGGIVPGFDSHVLVAPSDGVAVIGLTNGSVRAMLWLPAELGRMLDRELGVAEVGLRTDVPHHPEVWPRITGRYSLDAALSDVRSRMMLGAGVQVTVDGGRPMLRLLHVVPSLLRGIPLHPDDDRDPYAFRIDLSQFGLATARVVFGPDHVATDLWPYIAYRRRGPSTRQVLGAGMLALGLAAGGASLVRRVRGGERP